ncbi:MAG: MerR family transcriptional regulator [Hyphomicrobiales bacterium]
MNETVQHHLGSEQDYSVGQLARLSGVSVRTLHHYHAIDLLQPAFLRENGYRLYRKPQLLRLQEILFYREIGVDLAEIAELLDGPEDAAERLTRHRERLVQQAEQQTKMIAVLDATLAHLKGEHIMAANDLYTPFSDAKQAEYETWLIETYGSEMADAIATSKQAIAESPEGLEGAMEDLKNMEAQLVKAFKAGNKPQSIDQHGLLEQHRALMARFWGKPCPSASYGGLADLYLSHPDFVARFERLAPHFSQWLPAAMKAHASRL